MCLRLTDPLTMVSLIATEHAGEPQHTISASSFPAPTARFLTSAIQCLAKDHSLV
jgi:hypothetical protein